MFSVRRSFMEPCVNAQSQCRNMPVTPEIAAGIARSGDWENCSFFLPQLTLRDTAPTKRKNKSLDVRRHISGTCGHSDCNNSGFLQTGDRNFICCPPTYTGKDSCTHSHIRLSSPQYSVVTDPRTEASRVACEHCGTGGKIHMGTGRNSYPHRPPGFFYELLRSVSKIDFWKRFNRK